MRTTYYALILAGAAGLPLASPAFAADAAPSPHTLTANVSLVTDYYFRGMTQTWHKPALQGGADYSHASGWYAGVWGSNISGNQYPGGSLELDYYGGYNGKFNDDLGWTLGGYGYYYPGANANKAYTGYWGTVPDQKYDTFEWNAGLSYKWISAKYSRTVTDWFGANTKTGFSSDTKGSSYLELNASIPVADGLTLGLHVAHTDVKATYPAGSAAGATNPDYNDYKISLTKSFKDGWFVGAAYVKSSNGAYWDRTASTANTDTTNMGEGKFILSAGRSF